MLQVADLEVTYATDAGTVRAVKSINFTVPEGEFYSLLGPSGCGKTSTLRAVAGLETPTGGRITIDGQVVFDAKAGIRLPTNKRDIGMVFQSYAIWPHLTVAQNVEFPLVHGRNKAPRSEIKGHVHRALSLVHLEDLADRPAPQLSGGQQQRVALARALVHEPKVLLLDEPLSNLDAKLRDEMRGELKELVGRLGTTTLYVTHDQVEGLTLSDKLAVMNEGLIEQEGNPRDVYLSPATPFVAGFVGRANVVPTSSVGDAGDGLYSAETPVGRLLCFGSGRFGPDTEALVVFRPESVVVSRHLGTDTPNTVSGTVTDVTFAGELVDYKVAVHGFELTVHGDAYDSFIEGEEVFLHVLPQRCLLVPQKQGESGASESSETAHSALASAP